MLLAATATAYAVDDFRHFMYMQVAASVTPNNILCRTRIRSEISNSAGTHGFDGCRAGDDVIDAYASAKNITLNNICDELDTVASYVKVNISNCSEATFGNDLFNMFEELVYDSVESSPIGIRPVGNVGSVELPTRGSEKHLTGYAAFLGSDFESVKTATASGAVTYAAGTASCASS